MPRLEVEIGAINKDLVRTIRDSEKRLAEFQKRVQSLNLSFSIKGSVGRSLSSDSSAISAALEKQAIATEAAKTKAAEYRAEIARMNLESKKAKGSIDAASGSYRESQQRLTGLGKSIREATNGFNLNDKEVRKNVAEYARLNAQLKSFDKLMGNNQRNVGNYRDALGGLGGQLKTLIGQYVSFYAVLAGARAVAKSNVEISDTIADVQRTAELSKREVAGLVEELRNIPSRTGLNELLGISVIGGQLGIAKDELAGFTQALDFLGVALAKEIPGGAEAVAEALGKINGVFRVAQNEGLTAGQAMQKTGSAILALGQAGLATGKFLVDFTQRVGGAARTVGIALPTVLAYGAVLEEAGVSAEVAGTAVSKLIGQLAAKRADFHVIARMADATLTLQEFTDLINTDADAALRKFFAGLAAGGRTTTQFYDILNSAGIKTERYRNAVLLLSQDQEKLTKLTALSAKEYAEGSTAAEQFAMRNLNLAGVLQQVGRRLQEAFVDIGAQESIAQSIAQVLGLASASDVLTSRLKETESAMASEQIELNKLIDRYGDLIANSNRSHKENEELKKVINDIGNLMPSVVTQWDNYGNALSISISRVTMLSRAHSQLVKDMNISTTKQLNEDFAAATKRAERYKNAVNEMAKTNKDSFMDWRTGAKGTLDNFRQWLAEANSEALKIAQNLQAIGAELTQEQKNLLVYYGLDEAGEAMRRYDQSIRNAATSTKELGDSTQQVTEQAEDLTEEQQRALDKQRKDAEQYQEHLRKLRETAHLDTLQGNERELQAARYRWEQELKDARHGIRELLELRKMYVAETMRIMAGMTFTQTLGSTSLQRPLASATQLNSARPDFESAISNLSRKTAIEYTETNEPKVDWSSFTDGLKRATNQFVRSFSNALEQIGTMTERKADTIIGHIGLSLVNSFSSVFDNVVSNKLSESLKDGFNNIGQTLGTGNKGKWLQFSIIGAGIGGQITQGVSRKTDVAGQTIGGLLSGAAAGASFGSIIPGLGTAIGAALGAAIGGLSGFFSASSSKRQERLQEQQLEQQRKQTALLERQNALSYTSSIIGQQTNNGMVTGVERNEFGELIFRIQGQDLVASVSRTSDSEGRGR